MIDFSRVNAAVKLTPEFVLSKVDDVQIFRYYFGEFELGRTYPSKFRRDRNASTGFYVSKHSKRLIYNDLSTGEKLDCFKFVAKLHGLSFNDVLQRIALDFGLMSSGTKPVAQKILTQPFEINKEEERETLIQCIFYPYWSSTHAAYWNQYGVSVDDCKKAGVYPVKELHVNKVQYKIDDLCFGYAVKEKVGKEVKVYTKVYQPYSKTMKWLSNVPITVPFGLYELKYGTDHVIVGKAQKDRLILLKLFESVIGTQNESESALQDKLVKHLCFNFPRRTIIWDADKTGVENCTKFNSRGFGYFNTPNHLLTEGIKDVSDYVKAYGLSALEKLLRSKNIL
jgi:hypothetical protein